MTTMDLIEFMRRAKKLSEEQYGSHYCYETRVIILIMHEVIKSWIYEQSWVFTKTMVFDRHTTGFESVGNIRGVLKGLGIEYDSCDNYGTKAVVTNARIK